MDLMTVTAAATRELGSELYEKFGGSGVIALVGSLGAGKTQLTIGLCEAAGVAEHVSSPTFGIVHEYPGKNGKVCHFDFYRLKNELELWDIGWQEYLDGGALLVVEWADRFPSVFPDNTHWVKLEHCGEEARRIRLKAGRGVLP